MLTRTAAKTRRPTVKTARPASKTARTTAKTARTTVKKPRAVKQRAARQRVLLMAGTRKGAFIFETGTAREKWTMGGPHFPGWGVQHLSLDRRSGLPGTLCAAPYHDVYGANIHRSTNLGARWQIAEGPAFPADSGLKLKRIWRVEPGHALRPNEVWAGADPGAHFKSEDGGQTWAPKNRGSPACFLPEGQPDPEAGQCCYHLVLSRADPDLWVRQNHCGVYRSEDGGQRGLRR